MTFLRLPGTVNNFLDQLETKKEKLTLSDCIAFIPEPSAAPTAEKKMQQRTKTGEKKKRDIIVMSKHEHEVEIWNCAQ